MGRAEAANVEGEQARARSSPQLGKYQLLAVLGRGGMAEVFLALSRGAMGFDKLAVIKRLRPEMADDDDFRAMFLDEARLAARLNHPNVVHTYEVGEHDGIYYLAMEYLEGQPLNRVMTEGVKQDNALDPRLCARLISDALAGLHHAHTLTDFDGRPLGIIHRDISPHNLFVTYEGSAKVVDFGIAKAALSSTHTEVGVLKGKAAYMSPEQATGQPIDARSDVFAMGIVLWELLTQRRLMTGDSAASTIQRLLTAPIPSASTFRSDVTAGLDAIVERALQKDPDERFPSALAMREALEHYLAVTGGAPRTEEIGRHVGRMFTSVRESIKRQIQEHVEGAAKAATDLRGTSQVRPRDASMVSGELPMLGSAAGMSSGSSGVVARPHPSRTAETASMQQPAVAPVVVAAPVSRRILAIGFGLLMVAVVATTVATQLLLNRSAPVAAETQFVSPPTSSAPPPPVIVVAEPALTVPLPAIAYAPTAQPTDTSPSVAVSSLPVAPPPHPASRAAQASQPTPPPTAAPPAAPAGAGPAFLTFDTYPWSRVSEGGTSLGTTPLVHLALPAGTHTLTLDNPDQGIHQTFAITLKAGEATTKRLGLK